MFLIKVVDQLSKYEIPYAIAGGYALALHGIVRATMDVDLILNLKKHDFIQFEKAMKEISLKPRLPLLAEQVIEFRKEYISERSLIAWSFVNYQDPTEVVDVLLIEDLAKIDSEKILVGEHRLNVISIHELKRMKTASARPQDLIDIENINKALHQQKGKSYVEKSKAKK